MIHEIGVELGKVLVGRGCPLKVVDGPERTLTTTFGNERIVIEFDEGGDTFGPARSQRQNPKQRMTHHIGMKITIYAQSATSGAAEFEHRRRARAVLDQVLVGLGDVARARRNEYTPKGGKFIKPAHLAKSEVIGGAVYELSFTYSRGVPVTTFAGAARPQGSLADVGGRITSTTRVSAANGPDDGDNDIPDTAETACGA